MSQITPISSSRKKQEPFLVGIGASAGGLEALRALLSEFTASTGVSYVVVQHMAPKYRSMLTDLLSRDAHVVVEEARDKITPQPNVMYVTPPNFDIIFEKGQLRLVRAAERTVPKPSVDKFFTSLAEELGERCGGIILSGTGSDGAQGIRAIKAAGGFAIAQDPESAKYDGMPRAAINTGVVDLVLSPQEISRQLDNIVCHLLSQEAIEPPAYPEEPFRAVLEVLKRHSRVDFNLYKPNTLRRRIHRRMKANRIDSIEAYFDYLSANRDEVKRLFQDVLISVTSFFRDKEQYQSLRVRLREYLLHRPEDEGAFRLWSAGCCTGEEAYSLGILVAELLKELDMKLDVQIFATDVNEESMALARRGVYSAVNFDAVSQDVLNGYFEVMEGSYQVKRYLREQVVFARHDLTRDPPFLKMDLICCRNVFIYFDVPLQERILKIFHYAMRPGGLLFMGKAESISPSKGFFKTVDSAAKIYERNDRATDPSISFSSLALERGEKRIQTERPKAQNLGEHLRGMIRMITPNSLVLDEDLAVREVYGDARRFLQIPEGTLNQSVEKLLVEPFRNKVTTLLHRAKRSGEIAVGAHFTIAHMRGRELVQPRVYPVKIDGEPRLLLSFESVAAPAKRRGKGKGQEATAREIEELERELAATREHLQTVIQEQETSNEELQALNEELHSANEELQSTNEELETSNEELQSTNEELTTLNEELNVKSAELIDLNNFLAAVQDAIQSPIFVVDKNLNLTRFNDAAERTFKLAPVHLGKSVRLLPSKDALASALDAVEACLGAKKQQTLQVTVLDRSFEVQCDPFFNHKDEMDGVVVTLSDNTAIAISLKRVEESEKRLQLLFENIPAAVTVKDPDGTYTFVNSRFCQLVGRSRTEILGRTDHDLFDAATAKAFTDRDRQTLATSRLRRDEERFEVDGQRRLVLSSRFPLYDEAMRIESVCMVAADVTELVEVKQKLEVFKETISASDQGLLMCERDDDDEPFVVTFASRKAERILGRPASSIVGNTLTDICARMTGDSSGEGCDEFEKKIIAGSGMVEFTMPQGGKVHFYEGRSTLIPSPDQPHRRQLSLLVLDVTDRKESESLLRKQHEEVMKAAKLASLGEMAAGIAHELNTPLNTIQSHVDLIRRLKDGELFDENATSAGLDTIEKIVGRISEIVIGLKSFSRVDKNVHAADFDVGELLSEAIRMCDFHLRNKGVKVEFRPPRTPIIMCGRRTQISQVFVNLLNNSIDAVKNLSSRWIKVNIEQKGDQIILRVVDSGDGIPDKIAALVMTPFFTTKEEGTGLGLSLSRALVKAHGGELRIDDSVSNTCFEVTLPREGKPRESIGPSH